MVRTLIGNTTLVLDVCGRISKSEKEASKRATKASTTGL